MGQWVNDDVTITTVLAEHDAQPFLRLDCYWRSIPDLAKLEYGSPGAPLSIDSLLLGGNPSSHDLESIRCMKSICTERVATAMMNPRSIPALIVHSPVPVMGSLQTSCPEHCWCSC